MSDLAMPFRLYRDVIGCYNYPTGFVVQFTRDALKAPESLANNATKLFGSDFIRLRVGNYRVIMLPDGTVLLIVAIGPRGSIYE